MLSNFDDIFEDFNHIRWRKNENRCVKTKDRGDFEVELETVTIHARTCFNRAHFFDSSKYTKNIDTSLNETV